jgi:hypothetical protein
MKKKFIIIGLIFCSCGVTSKMENRNDTIVGRWCSELTTADYPHLTFRQDGYVFFDCKIDTVFGLKYTIDNDYLVTSEIANQLAIKKNHIIKLTLDSLIFETLLDLKTTQAYYRCDR